MAHQQGKPEKPGKPEKRSPGASVGSGAAGSPRSPGASGSPRSPGASGTGPIADPNICYIRTVGLFRAIAIGGSITVGLGIFVLFGLFLQQDGAQVWKAYLSAGVVFLPLVLTYAERALVVPGSGGMMSLVRASGSTWRTYASGWLLVGGHLTLIALLGWGGALYLNTSLERLLGYTIEMHWLAPAMVIVVALNDLIGTRNDWRMRVIVVYVGILILPVLAGVAWFFPAIPGAGGSSLEFESMNLVRIIALMGAMLWGLNFVLDKREALQSPERNTLPALLIPVLIAAIPGALVAFSFLRVASPVDGHAIPLSTMVMHTDMTTRALLEALSITTGMLICLVALDKAMVILLRLVGAMARDGFFPETFVRIIPGFGTPVLALHLFASVSTLAAAFVPDLILVGFTALMFFWTTALIAIPDSLVLKSPLPENRPLKLPFHPLVPSLAATISVFLPLALPLESLLAGGMWVLIGGGYYALYAQRGNIAARRKDAIVGDVEPDKGKKDFTTLVCVANPETAAALLHAGAVLARARKGRVLVLKVATFLEQVPEHLQRDQAHEQLEELQEMTRKADMLGVPTMVFVRLAQNPVEGILGAIQEQKADMVLLGWEGERVHQEYDLGPMLDPIIRAAACDVVVLRGSVPDQVSHVLVPTDGTPNTLAAMQLAQKLVPDEEGHVVALNLVQDIVTPQQEDTLEMARRRLQKAIDGLDGLDGKPPIDLWVVPTETVKGGILREAQNVDLLLLGASRGGVLDQSIFGGLPVEVARSSPVPTLLLKHYEGARRFWVRRFWEKVSAPFPNLTASERAEVYQRMHRAARPNIDFFILIGLAAMIATLGLLQGSPAVIIGAMLVAPLMSPILAIAMAIVRGNVYLLRLSAAAALLGVVLAISLGIAVTLVTPAGVVTEEILARTRPNLLDLLVALASGAAGGYAIARKEVATALPGVAIAAALVPPLGVVGYGTATAQLDIAGGSLLLFSTNLISIVFASAVVFLLLGFRPTQARRTEQVRIGFIFSLIALVLISIPLTTFSITAVGQISRQNQVKAFLNEQLETDTLHITDLDIEQRGNEFIVHAVIYSLDAFPPEQLSDLQDELTEAIGAPVTLRATVLRAIVLPNGP